MSLFSRSPLQHKELALLFDIGSGSVGAAVVEIADDTLPIVRYAVREDIAHYEHPAFKKFFRAMLNALENASHRLFKEAFGSGKGMQVRTISHIHCILASPWYTGGARILHYTHGQQFEITQELTQQIVAAGTVPDDATDDVSEKQSAAGQKTIEQKIIQIIANGYETSKPYGQYANRLEISLYSARVANELGSRIQGVIRKTFGVGSMLFHSFALASFTTIRDVYPDISSFMLLDVTGEVTDIFFGKSGALSDTCSIPYGKNTLVREAAQAMRETPESALSLIRMYVSGGMAAEKRIPFEAALAEAKARWVGLLETITAYIMQTDTIPKNVFIMADPDIAPVFAGWVQYEREGKKTVGPGGYAVTLLDASLLASRVSFAPGCERDFFVGIGATYIQVLHSLEHA